MKGDSQHLRDPWAARAGPRGSAGEVGAAERVLEVLHVRPEFFLAGGVPPAGTPEPRERFGVSVFDGSDFTAFSYFDPLHIFDVGLGTKSGDISAWGVSSNGLLGGALIEADGR